MIKTRPKIAGILAAIPAVACVTLAGGMRDAQASSHREAPLISEDPAADNTDLFAWTTPGTHDNLTIVANWIPLEEPSGGPNFYKFSDQVAYELHISRGNSLANVVAYTFSFTTAPIPYVAPDDLSAPLGGGKEFFAQLTGYFAQTLTVTKSVNGVRTVIAKDVPVAPPRIGPRTSAVLGQSGGYDDAFAATFIRPLGPNGSEGRVWAGPRDDGFFVDLGGTFDLANMRPRGIAQDGLAGFNIHSIVIEIPTTLLTGNGQPPGTTPGLDTTLGIWAAASRPTTTTHNPDGTDDISDTVQQVSRLGFPLINEAVIGLQDKDRWNRQRPDNDVPDYGAYYLNPVVVRDAEAVGQYSPCGPNALPSTCQLAGIDPTPYKTNRNDIIEVANLVNIPTMGAHPYDISAIGDVLRVDMAFNSGFPNGRLLADDVTDVILTLFLSGFSRPFTDGVDRNDKPFLASLPYQALPWSGYNEGHGRPTP